MITKNRPMDIYFSMFNCHVNNAKEKAIRRFKKKYGHEIYEKEIKPFWKAGIMSIFNKRINEYTKYFAESVQKFVNN